MKHVDGCAAGKIDPSGFVSASKHEPHTHKHGICLCVLGLLGSPKVYFVHDHARRFGGFVQAPHNHKLKCWHVFTIFTCKCSHCQSVVLRMS